MASSSKTAAALALEKSQDGQHSDVLELLKGLARHDRERKSKQDPELSWSSVCS